jgi:hypothetical protein
LIRAVSHISPARASGETSREENEDIRKNLDESERYLVIILLLEGLHYFLGFLRVVFHDAFQKGAHDILLESVAKDFPEVTEEVLKSFLK